MNLDVEIIVAVMITLLFIDFILAFRLIIDKLKRDDVTQRQLKLKEKLINKWVANKDVGNVNPYFSIFSQAKHLIKLDDETEQRVAGRLEKSKIIRKSFKGIKSIRKIKRIESSINLSLLATDEAAEALENALIKERKQQVKLYMANALSDIGKESSIPVLVASLFGESKWYRDKVNMLIAGFGEKAVEYVKGLFSRDEIEIADLIADIASVYPSQDLKEYIFRIINDYENMQESTQLQMRRYKERERCGNCIYGSAAEILGNKKCRYNKVMKAEAACRKHKARKNNKDVGKVLDNVLSKAADAACSYYFPDLAGEEYLTHSNPVIRRKAAMALSNIKTLESIKRLYNMLKDKEAAKAAQAAISEILRENPEYIDEVSEMLVLEEDTEVKLLIAESLSGKIEYFVMKLLTDEKEQAADIIEKVLLLGKTSELIGFLNNNKDKTIEDELINIIKKVISQREELQEEFSIYLNSAILKKAGLPSMEVAQAKKEYTHRRGLVRILYVELFAVILIFPVIYLFRHSDAFGIWSGMKHLKTYVIDFNYYLAFYSIAINLIYLILIGFSRINVSKQARVWKLKNDKMLFKKRMLPGISIIAPAYNEENVIIESANSLLNLKYPDYDLIIVNDGSTDNTLGVLIDYFELERVDYAYERQLKVAPIRGIYRNAAYPKLLVVDTENAGKADSLNSVIIISKKEYFCCIDSDSLLESDALLKLTSQTLDEAVETPALGGNVFPINGCKVSKGYIEEKRIPKNSVATFQTIEYIRAFMSGRLGWAYLNSLLIISGAFGVFRKERVINVGGYLTQNSKYNKDTVGEDMELVVRISRLMHEQKKKFRINYCYNANCWTEVPEKVKQLKRQRLRWFRGLAETLHFHIKTLFNPRYKRMGLIGMPYFFLFEMLGPLIEVQGYIMVLLAFILGILSPQIALLLFVASVMLGVLISIISLIIGETENNYYSYKDILRLLGVAVIENFGPRQLFSFLRVAGFFDMFSKEHSWGEQKRKGFADESAQKGEAQ